MAHVSPEGHSIPRITAVFYNSKEQLIVKNPNSNIMAVEWTIYIINRSMNQHHLTHIQNQMQPANLTPPLTPRVFVVEWSPDAVHFFTPTGESRFIRLSRQQQCELVAQEAEQEPSLEKAAKGVIMQVNLY